MMRMGTPETLAARQAEARKRAGLTQRALADLAGVSPAYIGRIEAPLNRIENPPERTLQRIADALGVHLRWLSRGTGPVRRRAA